MTATTYANGAALRQRLLHLGISDRDFAKTTGLGDIGLRTLLRNNQLQVSVTIQTIRRVLTESGLNPAELLDPPPETSDLDPSDDIRVLAQCLLDDPRRHPEHRLAVALGWTLGRVRDTADVLTGHLSVVGLRVHGNGMGLTLAATDGTARPAIQALTRHRDDEDGLDIGTARILHAIYAGRLSTTAVPRPQQPKLAALLNRGLIHENTTGEGARFRLTQPVLTAISPPAPSAGCRERRGRS